MAPRFEHYELVLDKDDRPLELGRGAMGVTYKAIDVDLHRPVTLKGVNEKYLGEEAARQRFLEKHVRRPVFVIQTLPRSSTWAGRGAITSTRWSLSKGEPSTS